MMSKVSVIIPCFNSGEFIDEAVSSANACANEAVMEIIIINDGSTDDKTLDILAEYSANGITVLHQNNKGPAGARNTGVKAAKGEYLLFLDSDNKVRNGYLSVAIAHFQKNEKLGVVYGKPEFFGSLADNRFAPGKFDLTKILIDNYIDMCTVVRKSMFDSIGGFDESKVLIGHEDWELWIRAAAHGWKFHYVDEILFDYRVRPDSLITQVISQSKLDQMKQYVYAKHWQTLLGSYVYLFEQNKYYHFDKARPMRSFIKYTRLKFNK